MNVLTPTLGLGVGYSERYAQQSKCSNVSTKTLKVIQELLPTLRGAPLAAQGAARSAGGGGAGGAVQGPVEGPS